MQHTLKLAVAVCGVGFCYWLIMPPHDLALDSMCQLTGTQARLSEALYGPSFWEAQNDAVDRELALLQSLSLTADKDNEDAKAAMSPTESRMTRLSSGESSGSADEQAEAQAREQRERFEQMGHLAVCRAVIAKHLGA